MGRFAADGVGFGVFRHDGQCLDVEGALIGVVEVVGFGGIVAQWKAFMRDSQIWGHCGHWDVRALVVGWRCRLHIVRGIVAFEGHGGNCRQRQMD